LPLLALPPVRSITRWRQKNKKETSGTPGNV
jgi:hypothetical protein